MSLPLLLVALVVLILAITLVTLYQLRRCNAEAGDTYTLGVQMAAAAEVDRHHRSLYGDAISPLAGIAYDRWNGETDLLSPIESPLDSKIQELLRRFAQSSPAERDDFRARQSMDDFYTLLTFSRRVATFAMRSGDNDKLHLAFLAMAAIDATRIDPRDMNRVLAMLNHCAKRLDASRRKLFHSAAVLASSEGSRIINSFHRRLPWAKTLRNWSLEEVVADNGAGFANWFSFPYSPTINPNRALLAIAAVVRADRYAPGIDFAMGRPPDWFRPASPEKKQRRDAILKQVRAVSLVSGRLRPEHHERADAQSFFVFLFECASNEDAVFLARLALCSRTEARIALTARV